MVRKHRTKRCHRHTKRCRHTKRRTKRRRKHRTKRRRKHRTRRRVKRGGLNLGKILPWGTHNGRKKCGGLTSFISPCPSGTTCASDGFGGGSSCRKID